MKLPLCKTPVKNKRGALAEQYIHLHPYLSFGLMFFIVPAAILLSVTAISVLFAFALGLI